MIASLLSLALLPDVTWMLSQTIQPQTMQRNASSSVELPVASGPYPLGREADHATVAINSNNDILAVFHTDLAANQKQVEVVYWRYVNGSSPETWTTVFTPPQYSDTVMVVGDSDPNPILDSGTRKCERPAVVAVDEYFCVVWSRTYTKTGPANDLSLVECAWIKWDPQAGVPGIQNGAPVIIGLGPNKEGFQLLPNNLTTGLPDPIQVEECSGVADVTGLGFDATTNTWRVMVAYVHQTQFGGTNPSNGNGERRFEMRFVECGLNPSSLAVSRFDVDYTISGIKFNGYNKLDASGSLELDTGGLILPELARGASMNTLFLTFEEQWESPPPASDPFDGRIRLGVLVRTPGTAVTLTLDALASYISPARTRRRSQLSSNDTNSVTFAFTEGDTPLDDGDLVVEEWGYVNGNLARRPYIDAPFSFMTSSSDDLRPVTVHGASNPDFRRCYFERVNATTCEILEFNPLTPEGTGNPRVIVSSPATEPLGRPATDYLYNSTTSAGAPHYVPLTYQKTVPVLGKQRVFIRSLGY
ncbi:MAG: hypothetical protein EYC70_09145 [Planctomycetota bacterium]|nr:MAG: hypothetical protein EYC70_09145 [Planctomycetota bacterium]